MATQVPTRAQRITGVATIMLYAVTGGAKLSVHVNKDSTEMENSVRVSTHDHFYISYV